MENKRKTKLIKKNESLLEEELGHNVFDILNKEEHELIETIEKIEETKDELIVEETKDELNYDQLMELVNNEKIIMEDNEFVSIIDQETSVGLKYSDNHIPNFIPDYSVEKVLLNKDDILKFIKDFEKSITFHQMVKKHELNGFLIKLKTML
jgi:hypothetical protein